MTSYAKFDNIVAAFEKDEQDANKVTESPEDIAQRSAFLKKLPPAMRDNPALLESLKTSNSFKGMISKTKITRNDVEAWARGEDEPENNSRSPPPAPPVPPATTNPTTSIPTYESNYSTLENVVTLSQNDKNKGNAFFKAKKLQEAILEYTNGIKRIEHYKSSNNSATKVWTAMLSNRAQCHLQLKDYSATILDCTVILLNQPNHVKALWRRSQALEATNDITSAASDLRELLRIEPKNKKAKRTLKSMVASERLHLNNITRNTTNNTTSESNSDNNSLVLFQENTKKICKAIKKQNLQIVEDMLPNYTKYIQNYLLTSDQWKINMSILYTSDIDDALLSLMSLMKENDDDDDGTTNEKVENEKNGYDNLFKHVRIFFNCGFTRLMKYTDEEDDLHFFGSKMMSSRAQVRALLRTAMTGNKSTLERLKHYLNKEKATIFQYPQIWICNADRELMNRIRSKDTKGALFHAFEGEIYRHIIRGTLNSTFFSIGEQKGGIEYIMSNSVQKRLKYFVAMSEINDVEE